MVHLMRAGETARIAGFGFCGKRPCGNSGAARRALLKLLAGALPLLPASAAALIAFAFLAGALPASAQSTALGTDIRKPVPTIRKQAPRQ